jgi:two-component system NarL family response regulator
MTIRVAIVEDQRIVLELLAALLAREPDIVVVGQATTGRKGLELVQRARPDVLLLDVSLPDMDGIAVALLVRERYPEVKVIALSIHDEPAFVQGMLQAGAHGYVHKSATVGNLREAIRAVDRGEHYLSPVIRIGPAGRIGGSAGALGKRELQVVALLAEGKRSVDIARRLSISTATVDVHRRNIMRKLDLHTIAELTKFALRHGLTSL